MDENSCQVLRLRHRRRREAPPDLVVERRLSFSRGRERCSFHDVERVDLTASVETVNRAASALSEILSQPGAGVVDAGRAG